MRDPTGPGRALPRRPRHDRLGAPARSRPSAELPARYAAADVYVSPGELESFGIAALEARTVGLPVVGRQGSGIGEFVTDAVNGYLTTGDDDLAAAVARLAADPALRERMRRHNVEHPPAQGWPQVVEAAEREYARAIDARSGARR